MDNLKIVAEFIEELKKYQYGHPGALHVDWRDVEKEFRRYALREIKRLKPTSR